SGIAHVETWSIEGSTWLHNLGGLEVGGVNAGAQYSAQAGGTIDITASSPITVTNNNLAAGNITYGVGADIPQVDDDELDSTDPHFAEPDDITVVTGVIITSTGGSINI